MLDSGAFSEWTRGIDINLEQYKDYLIKNKKSLDFIINLDVIPGFLGRDSTSGEIKSSAKKSWENFLYLSDAGIEVIPVFHQRESFKWLDKMIDYGCTYIGISARMRTSTSSKLKWLDVVFNHITDDQGRVPFKTHGFGLTAIKLMYRYPWHSVDSNSWIMIGGTGNILFPPTVNGELSYAHTPISVTVSEKSPQLKNEGKHFNSFSTRDQAYIIEYLKGMNLTIGKVKFSDVYRYRCNLEYYKRVEAEINKKERLFVHKKKGIIL